MLQLVPPARPTLAVVNAGPTPSEPLLAFAGPVAGAHALVIAPNGLDLLCSLLRHGCAAATALRDAERSEHEAYDLVFAPSIPSAAQIGPVIDQAKRALLPNGRFLACVPTVAVEHAALGRWLVRILRLAGFAAIRVKPAPNGLLVRGDWLGLGLAGAMRSPIGRLA